MKKINLTFLVLLTLFVFTPKANALDYETPYMVRNNNNYALSLDPSNNYSYNFGETPWVYIKFKLSQLALSSPLHMQWVWSSLADPNITETHIDKMNISGLGSDKELWSSPQPWWASNGGPGTWQVNLNWVNVHGTTNISSVDFISCPQEGIPGIISRQAPCGPVYNPAVVPEPLSTTLFLLGGAPLLASLRRKQKTFPWI